MSLRCRIDELEKPEWVESGVEGLLSASTVNGW